MYVMNYLQLVILIILVLVSLLLGFAGSNLAKKRNRNQGLWFISCMFTGVLGLLVIACSPTLEYDEESGYIETDTLGWIIYVISLILFGLSLWYGYLVMEDYHSHMFWNSYFNMMR